MKNNKFKTHNRTQKRLFHDMITDNDSHIIIRRNIKPRCQWTYWIRLRRTKDEHHLSVSTECRRLRSAVSHAKLVRSIHTAATALRI